MSMFVTYLCIALLVISTRSFTQASQVPTSHAKKSHAKKGHKRQNVSDKPVQISYSSKSVAKIVRVLLLQLLAQSHQQKSDSEIRSELSDMLEILQDLEPKEILGVIDITPEKVEQQLTLLLKRLHTFVAGNYERFPEAKELRNLFINAYNQLQETFTYSAVEEQNMRQSSRPFLGDPKLLQPRI